MIIDSHAHYAHETYEGEFPYIDLAEDGYVISRSDRSGMFERMKECGISAYIEAATSFKRHEEQRALAAKYRGFVYFSTGLHPKECALTPLRHRNKLRKNASQLNAIAIGETGLDYSTPEGRRHKLRQKLWFKYQIKLANKLHLPLILHVRDADEDALKILKKHKKLLNGGVAHCFHGDEVSAKEYVMLGFALGIGSKLLEDEGEMSNAIKNVPLSSLLVETDAPYLRPDIGDVKASNRQKKKARNSSLILQNIIVRIAELRGEPEDKTEEAIYQNTLRVFRLDK